VVFFSSFTYLLIKSSDSDSRIPVNQKIVLGNFQGRLVNVKHGTKCAVGKVGEDKNPKRGNFNVFYYKFVVIS